jgi:hypothetical protein
LALEQFAAGGFGRRAASAVPVIPANAATDKVSVAMIFRTFSFRGHRAMAQRSGNPPRRSKHSAIENIRNQVA